MPTITIETKSDIERAVSLLRAQDTPFTISITPGKRRSIYQNRLQRKWMKEAADQLRDESAEGYRAYCKLHFGVPILRSENEDFCRAYDQWIRPLSYEAKLAYMSVPLDFPVTRLMTVKQKKQYLADVEVYLRGLGVKLTDPGSPED